MPDGAFRHFACPTPGCPTMVAKRDSPGTSIDTPTCSSCDLELVENPTSLGVRHG